MPHRAVNTKEYFEKMSWCCSHHLVIIKWVFSICPAFVLNSVWDLSYVVITCSHQLIQASEGRHIFMSILYDFLKQSILYEVYENCENLSINWTDIHQSCSTFPMMILKSMWNVNTTKGYSITEDMQFTNKFSKCEWCNYLSIELTVTKMSLPCNQITSSVHTMGAMNTY